MITTAHAGPIVDPILLALSSLPKAPTSPETRFQFARAALVLFCTRRNFLGLAEVLQTIDEDDMKSYLNVFCHLEEFIAIDALNSAFGRELSLAEAAVAVHRSAYNEDGYYTPILMFLGECGAAKDPEFIRLATTASDTLTWEIAGEEEYIEQAWPVLCDEVEFELEEAAA